MSERVMALYIEDANIKLLIVNGRKVERWANVPLEPGLVSGGVIVEESQVAKKIKELLIAIRHVQTETAGFNKVTKPVMGLFNGKGKLIVGLSGRNSLYRVLSLPPLPDSLLAEAVRREASRVLPISLNELYLAYQRIPGGSSETRVFMVAFPKNATDILLRTLRIVGLKPRVLDMAPLALSLYVNEPRAIIVDARMDNLDIVIMAERVPQVIRSLALQSENKTVSENMPTIIEEFSRTVAFYNSSHQQDPLNSDVPVFVSGDLANEPDNWKSLVGNLNYKVSLLPIALEYPENFPPIEFIVNIGLASKQLGLEKQPGNYSLVNLNALPKSSLSKSLNPYWIIVPVVTVAGVAGIVLMWNVWQNTKNTTASLQSQLKATQNQITINTKNLDQLTTQNQAIQAKIQPLKDAANVLNTKLNTIKTARSLTVHNVQQIMALVPQTVTLDTVTYSDTGATLTGSAATQADVLNYAQILRDSGNFSVVVTSITYSSIVNDAGAVIDTYSFSFQIK